MEVTDKTRGLRRTTGRSRARWSNRATVTRVDVYRQTRTAALLRRENLVHFHRRRGRDDNSNRNYQGNGDSADHLTTISIKSATSQRDRLLPTALFSAVAFFLTGQSGFDGLHSLMTMPTWLWMGVYHSAAMLWATLWALVLGFGISAALQVFVSNEKMTRLLGRAGLKEMVLATGFGAASSSCSYAAASIGRSAFQQGAALIPALAFMFASTNLVVELGAVLWLLMGWQFVLAEVLGAFVLIGLMWLLMWFLFPKNLEAQARGNLTTDEAHCCNHSSSRGHGPTNEHSQKWTRLASAFWMDWQMLWKELVVGFLIAGFLAALVPNDWWKALFIETGSPVLRVIENAAVGPIIAIVSFVCSVGNIPLASLLWANGISFGGVISFIYADLLVLPLILIYRKYFGGRVTAYIVAVFYVSMVGAGIVVDVLFTGLDLIPKGERPVSPIEHATFAWNYTTWLNFVAIGIALWLLILRMRSRRCAT